MAKKVDEENVEITEALEACLKEMNRITKSKKAPAVEKNSMKYMIPMVESTLKGGLDRESTMKNLVVALKALVSSGLLTDKSKDSIMEYNDLFSRRLREMKENQSLGQVDTLFRKGEPGDVEGAFQILANRASNGYEDGMERYIPAALDLLSKEDSKATPHVARFLYGVMTFKKDLFQFYREYVKELLKSRNPQVRGIAVMCCSTSGTPSVLKDLAAVNRDMEQVDISMFQIPDHKIRFPNHDGKALLCDMAEDTIHEIVNRSRDKSLYLKNSVTVNFPDDVRIGEEFLFTISVIPIVDFQNLSINMTSLSSHFIIRGDTMINIQAITAGEPLVQNIRALPTESGPFRDEIVMTTGGNIRATLELSCNIEELQNVEKETSTGSSSGKSSPEHPLEIIRMKIESGQVKKVASALEELARYAGDDRELKDRISALSLMISVKGTEKISNSEMENSLSLLEAVKSRNH